jgi:predicted nucleotidyltransferase
MQQPELTDLLREIYTEMQRIFGDQLSDVILFGSYARGDFDEESDIDIAVLVDCKREELPRYHHALIEQSSHYMMDYDCLVSFTDIPTEEFNSYRKELPFYRNIDTEGVKLSA